jgi:sulfur relay (sulfurtransferase) DsrF/TusC family protein
MFNIKKGERMKQQTKIYINEATAVGFKQIASMFETLKFYKKDKVYFTEKDMNKLSVYALEMLLQIDEKKIDAKFDKIFKRSKKERA